MVAYILAGQANAASLLQDSTKADLRLAKKMEKRVREVVAVQEEHQRRRQKIGAPAIGVDPGQRAELSEEVREEQE